MSLRHKKITPEIHAAIAIAAKDMRCENFNAHDNSCARGMKTMECFCARAVTFMPVINPSARDPREQYRSRRPAA